MSFLPLIMLEVMLPIFILLLLGAVLHRIYDFHLSTLSKLLTGLFLPVVIFTNISAMEVESFVLLDVGTFLIIQFLLLALLAGVCAKLFGMDAKLTAIFKNSVVLMNSGNFGLPVSQLVFASNPLGVSIQIIVLMFQNFLTFTYGIFTSATTQKSGIKENMAPLFKTPTIYALALGLVFYIFNLSLPKAAEQVLNQIAAGFTALALLVLGAQIAYPKLKYLSPVFFFTISLRLVGAPLIALGIIWLLQLEGTTAQALFIASSFPMSRNSALFALEYDNYPEYAAQSVLISTMLGGVTVSIVILLSQVWFG
ncbi:AEC family transporter [Marinococcus sp. PL1-022]|uniref:AEC family transporter n=1 Tax=Marinococcus sp. PL1-022 TaxID=3095363 RepID=UPI0029C41C2A|nr:AEC family transporter [Marinococcus sp. PL1-022]MDX6152223.1 AEC family transporter [Marinococcus sp. PL1-022]